MDFEPTQVQYPQPEPPAAKAHRRIPRFAVASGLAVGLALGVTGIAFAAGSGSSSNPSTSNPSNPSNPSTSPTPHGRFGRGGMGGMGAMGLGGVGGRVLYGQATLGTASGGTKTVDFQVGTVSAVSGTSITVKSSDGHSQTYAVVPSTIVDSQAGGISSVSGTDSVRILATESNGTMTATDIVDVTKMRSSRSGFFGAPQGTTNPSTNPSTGSVFGGMPGMSEAQ